MPLSMVEKGKVFRIQKVSGKEDVKRHLEELGFIPGTSVSIISEMGGNMIINVKGSRVAIGRDLALKICV